MRGQPLTGREWSGLVAAGLLFTLGLVVPFIPDERLTPLVVGAATVFLGLLLMVIVRAFGRPR